MVPPPCPFFSMSRDMSFSVTAAVAPSLCEENFHARHHSHGTHSLFTVIRRPQQCAVHISHEIYQILVFRTYHCKRTDLDYLQA